MLHNLYLLFISSFLSATLLPMGSELHFYQFINSQDIFFALLIATCGNSLGAILNYYLGFFVKIEWAKKYLGFKEEQILKAQTLLSRYGLWLSFFCFLPIIGDPISFVLGLNKFSKWKCFSLITLGKFMRYLAIYLIFKAS